MRGEPMSGRLFAFAGVVLFVQLGCGGFLLERSKPGQPSYDGIPVYVRQAVKIETWRYKFAEAADAAKLQDSLISNRSCDVVGQLKNQLVSHELSYGAEPRYDTLYVASAKYMWWGTRTIDVKVGADGSMSEGSATSTGTAGADLASLVTGIVASPLLGVMADRHGGLLISPKGPPPIIVSCAARYWREGDGWSPKADPDIVVNIDSKKPDKGKEKKGGGDDD